MPHSVTSYKKRGENVTFTENLEKATHELMSIGYIQHDLDHRDVVLLEFKLKDTPGAVTPILELISEFNFNIIFCWM